MAAPLLSLQDIALGFGGAPLLNGIGLSVMPGERLGLVGRNGSGKSTLLRIAAGQVEPDRGSRVVQQGTTVAYLPQQPSLEGQANVQDYVAAGLPAHLGAETWRAAAMLDAVELDGSRPIAELSGGELRRASLGRALVAEPDLLLLDEPTNHLDIPTIEWLEALLQGFSGAYVVISHDRRFLSARTRGTLWLDRGRLHRMDGDFSQFEAWAEGLLAEEEARAARQQKLIAQETAWSRAGISARRRRNQGRLRRLQQLRREHAQRRRQPGSAKLQAVATERTGDTVIDARALCFGYGEGAIVKDLSLRILRGDRIGIIGPNGAGKSTLLRLLTGALAPQRGEVRLMSGLRMAFLDQQRSRLDLERSPWEVLCESGGAHVTINGRPRHVVGYLRDFLFEESQARTPSKNLSGGERNRLLLAKALAEPADLLVLDEPTNDLDLETLEVLQEALADFAGTVLLVSHDRDFLDRVVTASLALEGNGRAVLYAGGYTDMLAQRAGGPQTAAPEKQGGPGAAAKPASRPRSPGKLSYRQARDLALLPQEIAALEKRQAELEAALADPAFYDKDAGGYEAAARELDAVTSERTALEERWLELEMLREELESGN